MDLRSQLDRPSAPTAAQTYGNVELNRVESFTWHVDMDHLGESRALVGKVGWKEAFAIQKLEVRCRNGSNDSQEPENEEEHLLLHNEL